LAKERQGDQWPCHSDQGGLSLLDPSNSKKKKKKKKKNEKKKELSAGDEDYIRGFQKVLSFGGKPLSSLSKMM
jgi:hypothetical protein